MKQKNYKWMIYAVLFVLLIAVCYLSIHEITPLSEHIEQDIAVNMR